MSMHSNEQTTAADTQDLGIKGTWRLVSLAERLQLTTPEEAAGHCLSVSLDFALAARQFYGVESRLVKWTVVGDRHYVDHWAVLLDDEHVLDMTHVQVDGRNTLVARIDSFPANFRMPRVYPAELLTGSYLESQEQGTGRFTSRFLWTCGARLFRHDVRAALASRDVSTLGIALRQGGQFLGLFLMGCMTRWLEGRARRLMGRLHEQHRVHVRWKPTGRDAGSTVNTAADYGATAAG
jgi:hypothetical protein